jgi:RimJ/RimL family protein N-acetyltransferase
MPADRPRRSRRPEVALRPWSARDGELLQRLLGTPEMMRHLGGPESPEAIRTRHERYLVADPEKHGLFAVTVGPDAEAVGWVGYWESEWCGESVWECGWSVLPEAQGRGVGTAAAALLVADARRRGTHRWLHAVSSVDNAASNALCRTLGFELLGEAELDYPGGHVLRSNDWRLDLGAAGDAGSADTARTGSAGLAAHDPRGWTTSGEWTTEAREEALARAPEFGRRFFAELFARYPHLSPVTRFLRWSAQAEDVYAVVDLADGGLTLQVDAALEYLILTTAADGAEFGDWDGDQVTPALAFVADFLAGRDQDAR